MFLQACLNGARLPAEHEALPTIPTQLATDAVLVAIIELPDGRPAPDNGSLIEEAKRIIGQSGG